jgi:hypothetical protein
LFTSILYLYLKIIFDNININTVVRAPPIIIRDSLLNCRVPSGVEFTTVLNEPLNLKIPVISQRYVDLYPDIFEIGDAEYLESVDAWLSHQLVSLTSEVAVVGLDLNWQNVLTTVASLNILLDQHDASSLPTMRPDFTAM